MIRALDSRAPSNASIVTAKAAGVGAWWGYFQGPNILTSHWWSDEDFKRVQSFGLATGAYCSGFALASEMHARAVRLGIPIALDVEGGIRGDGNWVDEWLATASAGLYGNFPFHHHSAIFHIVAGYYGYDPVATWPSWTVKPPTPCAWQWQGTHNEFGASVDSCWMDDEFSTLHHGGFSGGVDDMTPEEHAWLNLVKNAILGPRPASLGDPNTAGHSDGDFLTIFTTASTQDFITAYGQDGYNYISALYHGSTPKLTGGGSAPTNLTLTLTGTGTGKLS